MKWICRRCEGTSMGYKKPCVYETDTKKDLMRFSMCLFSRFTFPEWEELEGRRA